MNENKSNNSKIFFFRPKCLFISMEPKRVNNLSIKVIKAHANKYFIILPLTLKDVKLSNTHVMMQHKINLVQKAFFDIRVLHINITPTYQALQNTA